MLTSGSPGKFSAPAMLNYGVAVVSVAVALIGFGLAYSKYCKRSWEEQRELQQYGGAYPVLQNNALCVIVNDNLVTHTLMPVAKSLFFDAIIPYLFMFKYYF